MLVYPMGYQHTYEWPLTIFNEPFLLLIMNFIITKTRRPKLYVFKKVQRNYIQYRIGCRINIRGCPKRSNKNDTSNFFVGLLFRYLELRHHELLRSEERRVGNECRLHDT